MKSYTCAQSFDIKGRGTIYLIYVPWTETLPRKGEVILINRRFYKTMGVEYFANEFRRSEDIGIIAKAI